MCTSSSFTHKYFYRKGYVCILDAQKCRSWAGLVLDQLDQEIFVAKDTELVKLSLLFQTKINILHEFKFNFSLFTFHFIASHVLKYRFFTILY